MPSLRHADQLRIVAGCAVGAVVSAGVVPLALWLFALVPPLAVVLFMGAVTLVPVLRLLSVGFLVRWVWLCRTGA